MARPMDDAWIIRPRLRTGSDVRLFCFPYAGGSTTIFHKWPEHLPETIEVCAVQLPGRGSRIREALHTQMERLVEALVPQMLPYLDAQFAFFGHSLGAILAFELARALRRQAHQLPVHLFISGSGAPQLPYAHRSIRALPNSVFLNEVQRWGGTPPEVMAHAELMQLLLPALRADFTLRETYVYSDEPPLGCPITAFAGQEDPHVTRAAVEAWQAQTDAAFSLHMLSGDHFFLHNARPVLAIITQELSACHG